MLDNTLKTENTASLSLDLNNSPKSYLSQNNNNKNPDSKSFQEFLEETEQNELKEKNEVEKNITLPHSQEIINLSLLPSMHNNLILRLKKSK